MAHPIPADKARGRFLRALMRLNLACGLASGLALLIMMAVGAADVIGTNLDLVGMDSRPIPAAYEFIATLMVVCVFLALALGQARGNHIRVSVLVGRLPPAWQVGSNALAHALTATLFALIALFGWKSGFHATSVGEYAPGIINFPTWPARLILAAGASLMAVQAVVDLLGVLSHKRAGSGSIDPALRR